MEYIFKAIQGIEILDSRSNPPKEVEVIPAYGTWSCAAVFLGASTGIHEAKEKRDGENKR